jgi:hypothetical protein
VYVKKVIFSKDAMEYAQKKYGEKSETEVKEKTGKNK